MHKKEKGLCIPEPILPDEGIDEAVEAMDLDTVVAYARLHRIDFDDPTMWRDDMWPDLESELRVKVMDHMAGRINRP